jgi:hypothetical protein
MKRTVVSVVLAVVCVSNVAGAKLAGGGFGFFSGDARPTVLNRISFDLQGKEKAIITVTGDGKGDIDCYLYEGDLRAGPAHVKFVTRDDSKLDGCRLELTPTKTSPYNLLIQNTSPETEHYTVVIN